MERLFGEAYDDLGVMATPAWAQAQVRQLSGSQWQGAQQWARRTRAEHQVLDAVYTPWREAIERVALEREGAVRRGT